MRKLLIVLLVIMFKLSSCVMDSADGRLMIKNFSKDTVFFAYSDTDSLPRRPQIIIAHDYYRVLPLDSNRIIFNDAERDIDAYPGKHLYVFIISISTLRTHSWDEIVNRQLYDKRYSYSVSDLKKLDWIIKYP